MRWVSIPNGVVNVVLHNAKFREEERPLYPSVHLQVSSMNNTATKKMVLALSGAVGLSLVGVSLAIQNNWIPTHQNHMTDAISTRKAPRAIGPYSQGMKSGK